MIKKCIPDLENVMVDHYDGLLAKDNAFIGGQIYWYVPNQSTMITVDEAWLKKSGFIIDETRSNFEY